jgi:3'-phosphoadenosine 5'-phosphosulfate sulfotransferase (PAPS reductase)/FAD synthetase
MCMLLKDKIKDKDKVKKVKVKHPKGWIRPDSSELLPLNHYDVIIVALSGGKDSVACLLEMMEMCDAAGVPRSRIEAWHQSVDGAPEAEKIWDWPITDSYCESVCRVLGITYRRQWRDGGLAGELLKENDRTKKVVFELADGTTGETGGTTGKIGTRGRHPAQAADLRTRYCSPVVKIDVCSSAICNDPRLKSANVLVVTGERRDESTNRATYATVEERTGTNNNRRVDQFRPVLEWSESQVWDRLRRSRIRPHPAYRIGFGRCSCLTCIFNGPDEWATTRVIAPAQFDWHANVEKKSGHTIRMGLTVIDQADRGTPMEGAGDPELVALAMGRHYPESLVLVPVGEEWEMPRGAFRACGGPT